MTSFPPNPSPGDHFTDGKYVYIYATFGNVTGPHTHEWIITGPLSDEGRALYHLITGSPTLPLPSR